MPDMFVPDKYNAFIQRLRTNLAAANEAGYPVGELPGFEEVLDEKNVALVLQEVLDNEKLLDEIKNLTPGGAIKAPRDKTKPLHRAYTIACDDEGELYFLLEPKSNTKKGAKWIIDWIAGKFKTIKMAVRIDTPKPELYVSATIYTPIDDEKANQKLEEAKQEVELQNETRSKLANKDSVVHLIKGAILPPRMHRGKLCNRYVTFSRYRERKLEYYVDDVIGIPSKDMLKEKRDIMIQVIKILKDMEKAELAHQDVKPENFLIGNKIVAITDFGFATKRIRAESRIGTARYSSDRTLTTKLRDADITLEDIPKLPEGMKGDLLLSPALSRGSRRSTSPRTFSFESSAAASPRDSSNETPFITDRSDTAIQNDVWSALVVWHDMLYGRLDVNGDKTLENMERDPFLNAMLEKYNEDRLNSFDELLVEFEKYYADENLSAIYEAAHGKSPVKREPTVAKVAAIDVLNDLEAFAKDTFTKTANIRVKMPKISSLANILRTRNDKISDPTLLAILEFNDKYLASEFKRDVEILSSDKLDETKLLDLLEKLQDKLLRLESAFNKLEEEYAELHTDPEQKKSAHEYFDTWLHYGTNKQFYSALAYLCANRLAEVYMNKSNTSWHTFSITPQGPRLSKTGVRENAAKSKEYRNLMNSYQDEVTDILRKQNKDSFVGKYGF